MNLKVDECWASAGKLYVPDKEVEPNPEHNYIALRGHAYTLAVMDKTNTCLGWIDSRKVGFQSVADFLAIHKDRSFLCDHCHKVKTVSKDDLGTGYAYRNDNSKVCYECCAIFDREDMRRDGKITLYLVSKMEGYAQYSVSNWPGTLKIPCYSYKKGMHNIGGSRIDVWFEGPDNHIWWGVHTGYNHQLVRCKRTKRKVKQNEQA